MKAGVFWDGRERDAIGTHDHLPALHGCDLARGHQEAFRNHKHLVLLDPKLIQHIRNLDGRFDLFFSAGETYPRGEVLHNVSPIIGFVDETYYWAYVVEYFSPWVSLASTKEEVEPAVEVANVLDELGVEENEVLMVPESFLVPSCQIAAVECRQMVVRADCIAFTAIPKHASFHVQTVEIALSTLEAAVTGASTARV